MPHTSNPRRQVGMTLVDLMISISIMVIVLSLGVPGFRTLVAHAKMTTAANSLIGHLHFARSEAVKRGRDVTVCPSADGSTCLTDASALWSGGYIVRVDGVTNALRRVDASEMSGTTVAKNGLWAEVVFRGDGSASGYMCTFAICDTGNPNNKRAVVVSSVGRVRVSDYSATGGALTCP